MPHTCHKEYLLTQHSNYMKKLYLYLLTSLCLFSSCTTPEYDLFANLHGIVSDYSTGNPISGVTLVLSPGGVTKITGSDGYFEFQSLTPAQYTITAQKDGYETNRKSTTAISGESTEVNITLKKIKP